VIRVPADRIGGNRRQQQSAIGPAIALAAGPAGASM